VLSKDDWKAYPLLYMRVLKNCNTEHMIMKVGAGRRAEAPQGFKYRGTAQYVKIGASHCEENAENDQVTCYLQAYGRNSSDSSLYNAHNMPNCDMRIGYIYLYIFGAMISSYFIE
jgi:hypothetical protein